MGPTAILLLLGLIALAVALMVYFWRIRPSACTCGCCPKCGCQCCPECGAVRCTEHVDNPATCDICHERRECVDRPHDHAKADLPPDVALAIDSGGSMSNDQTASLLVATGNEASAVEITGPRSHSDGESLTDYERGRVKAGRCPDCGHEGFLAGPRGGMAQNFACANDDCGSRFNDVGPFGIDRISEPSPSNPLGNSGVYR